MTLENQDLTELLRREKTVQNAIKKYNKTRPSASAESVRRAKEFKFGLHPSFKAKPEELEDFTKKIKDFRPAYNILELNAKFAGKNELAETMKAKRLKLKKEKEAVIVQESVEEVKEMEEMTKKINFVERSAGKIKRGQMASFRADGFLDYDGKKVFEKGQEISQLSIEMPMDDELGLRKRDKMVWDNRKKKYVQMQKQKEKFEVNEKSQRLYKEWKKETKKRIQQVGENEDPDIVKKVERRNREKFSRDPRENFNKIRKDKYKERMMHKKNKKFDLKKKLETRIQKKSAFGKSKMIIRN